MGVEPASRVTEVCAHCGDACGTAPVRREETVFCCTGCAGVYELLHANGLDNFYRLDPGAGRRQTATEKGEYAWLDLAKLADRFVRYRDAERTHVLLELPSIHCASCIWLLEQLPRLLPGVITCTVDFSRRTATIIFDHQRVSLRQLAETLAAIGYPPHTKEQNTAEEKPGRDLIFRIGVAGFAFGNVMLLSFPEYLGLGADAGAGNVGSLIGYLLLILSVPVMFYSGNVFLSSAWYGLRARRLTIDVPIALGMLALFGRSAYEILTHTGAGYLDSLAGLVFFLLIGRWFQTYTFARLSFDRDYRDYFPVAALRLHEDGTTSPLATEDIQEGDKVLIRPGQLIPADGVLLATGAGGIDYSFVTGEADPQPAEVGQEVFAGGRAIDRPLELLVTKPASQSYLLQLWRRDGVSGKPAEVAPAAQLTRWFTLAVLLLAGGTFAYWSFTDVSVAMRAATAVLIIACPCALALAAPFVYGTLQRLLADKGLYLRGPAVVERLGQITTLFFDKTGTLSHREGEDQLRIFDAKELGVFRAMAAQSDHPRSRALFLALAGIATPPGDGEKITETVGQGVVMVRAGKEYRLGSAAFCGLAAGLRGTYGCVDGTLVLMLSAATEKLRVGAEDLLTSLGRSYETYLLSGDHPPRTNHWTRFFRAQRLFFRQSPFAKQQRVTEHQQAGETVLMLGDGLNDAGALAEASVGLAVSEDEARFSPACDGILAAENVRYLDAVLTVARRAKTVLLLAYGVAFVYNLIGLSYAVTGTLSPVVAAILMPLSSLTVVLLGVLGATLVFRSGDFGETTEPLTDSAPAAAPI